MNDLISRQAAIDIERNATVDTNPSHFEAHQKFTQFINDAEISSFGRWQFSNGFNTALTAVGVDLKRLPSSQPERCEDCENFRKTRLLIPQPEIIHCENCKNWQTGWRNREWGLGYHWCSYVDGVRRSDWFCADAERRTDETD